MIDMKDAESVIAAVATRLSRRYSWLEKDELINEAFAICMDTDMLTKAISAGAFFEFIEKKLMDTQETERKWKMERLAPGELVELSDDGVAYTNGTNGRTVPFGRLEDGKSGDLPKPARFERSRLLDTYASMTTGDFEAWADEELGSAWGKKKDIRAFLHGSSAEQARLWAKYATGKRVNGGKRLVIDGVATTEREYQETLSEEWGSRYRSNAQLPRVMSADGQTIVVARMLRQPTR